MEHTVPARWSDMNTGQRHAFVEQCANRGMSTNDIAEMCGAASRNVIIGFAHRRGIILSKKKEGAPRQKPRRPWVPRVVPQTAPEETAPTADVPSSAQKEWEERQVDRNTTCVEEGCSEPVVFGKPYCRAHCAQYYVIPRAWKR